MSFITNIEEATVSNENFRKVLYTARDLQLVVMNLNPGESIGSEVHRIDQFIRVEKGTGLLEVNGQVSRIKKDTAFIINAGSQHNVTNISKTRPLLLYTIYSKPIHSSRCVQRNKKNREC